MSTAHDHTPDVFPWPNGMSFTLAEFIAVAERRLTEAHEEVRAAGTPDTSHTHGTPEPGQ